MGKPDVPAQTQERPLILVSLCAATFRRPDGLDRLVRSLARVQLSKSQVALELHVVDNDPDGSAETVCSDLHPEVPFPINYHIEPRRGIPYARNRSVAMIAPEADFAVFVDDDETVEPDWLEQLLRVQREYDADVVSGPVLPRFLSTPSPWIVKGRFFEHDRHQTGDRVDRAYTNNTLVRVEVLRRMAPQFDERMVLSGGSDKQFFRRVHEAGYRMVWANDAIVYEWVRHHDTADRKKRAPGLGPRGPHVYHWVLSALQRAAAPATHSALRAAPEPDLPAPHMLWCRNARRTFRNALRRVSPNARHLNRRPGRQQTTDFDEHRNLCLDMQTSRRPNQAAGGP